MNATFSTILNRHEKEDSIQVSRESSFISAIKKEFSNSKQILDIANSLSLTPSDFFAGNIPAFPVIPVRESNKFFIKKHTMAQIPYFHGHNFYELIYVHKGNCAQKFLNRPEFILAEKQCIILSPQTIHKIEKCKLDDIIIKMIIPKDLYAKTGHNILAPLPKNCIEVFDFVSETAQFAILKLLEQTAKESATNDLLIQSYLNILFAELANQDKIDIPISILLNDYFSENIKTATLSEFANKQNYNASHISRLIKLRTGKSFSQLLASYRIKYSIELLLDTSLSIETIALQIGYSNPSGFYKQFYNSYGMTPSEYRILFK